MVANKNQHYENLKLAINWNRYDIAKTDIFTDLDQRPSKERVSFMKALLWLMQQHIKPEQKKLVLEKCEELMLKCIENQN